MRLILIGPQGAGKGTQAQRISHETGAKHVCTGDLVRAEIRSGSDLGREIKSINNRGDLVPDRTIVRIIRPYLEDADSWILDGFPRNRAQAEALDEMLKKIGAEVEAAIALNAPDETSIRRLSGRRTSDATGRVYHAEHDPPPEDSEEDPGPFVQRKDDTEEAIRRRLAIYHEQTEPLKDYYAQRGILMEVDATGEIPVVTRKLLRITT